jgi:hypothetical protein
MVSCGTGILVLMIDRIDVALRVGLVASLLAVVVLAVLFSRQRAEVIRLQVQVHEIESEVRAQPACEPCRCEPREPEGGLLGACTASLRRARARLEEAQSAAQEAGSGPVQEGEHTKPDEPVGPASGSVPAQEHEEDRRVRDLFALNLGLAQDEMDSLGALVCATMALREALLADYAVGEAEAQKTWSDLSALRKDLTAEMEQILGPDRYRTFRAAGGIGALASAVDCDAVQ